jgi:hypothetical protein
MSDIYSLHGTTVAEIFSSGLENIDQIEAVAVSVVWKDGQITAGASNTSNERLAFMLLVLEQHIKSSLFSDVIPGQS